MFQCDNLFTCIRTVDRSTFPSIEFVPLAFSGVWWVLVMVFRAEGSFGIVGDKRANDLRMIQTKQLSVVRSCQS